MSRIMVKSYASALTILENTAKEVFAEFAGDPDVASIRNAMGRLSKDTVFSQPS